MPRTPEGFLPACIVPLYAIGRTLCGAFPVEGEADLPLAVLQVYGSPSVYAPLGKTRHAYDLQVRAAEASPIGVELQAVARERPAPVPRLLDGGDPERAARMRRPFLIPRIPGQATEQPPHAEGEVAADDEDDDAPEPPRELPKPLRSPTSIAVTLVPPYRDCLQPDRVSATARAAGFAGLARPLPKGVEVSLPSIADALGRAVRDALIAGAGSMVLVEDRTGALIDVPPNFWRTDASEAALAAEETVAMASANAGEVRGVICIDPHEMDMVWLRVRARLFGAAPPPRLRTPGAALLELVSHELGYVDGRPVRWNLNIDHIAAWVELRWNADELGVYKKGMATAIARLIALPEYIGPGARPTERAAQSADWMKVYAVAAGRAYGAIENR